MKFECGVVLGNSIVPAVNVLNIAVWRMCEKVSPHLEDSVGVYLAMRS